MDLRYVLIATVFATLAFSAVACGSGSQVDISPTQLSASVAAIGNLTDPTNAVCAIAVPTSKARTADYEKDVNNLFIAAALYGREAGERAIKAFRAKLMAWSEQLTALTRQPIAAEVKAALTEAAIFITKLADPNDSTPVDTAVTNLTNATQKLETACT
jgi:hypothetical protein